ncbi:MAG TPA: creatininase family protein [Nitrososphaera sp.]|nr:creatininase family protein [Nitrososphaera sp.]
MLPASTSSSSPSPAAVHVFDMSDLELWAAFKKTKKKAIIPIGSLEQHGPHLPVSTDTLIAEHVSRLVAQKVDALVLPALAYGVSFEHDPMFHVSLRNSTLSAMVCDMCASLAGHGISDIVIINGHHGNIGALQYIAQDLGGRIPSGTSINVLHYWHQMKERELGHAGEVETSLMLAIAPELVRMDRAKAGIKKPTKSKAAYASIANSPGSFVKITGNGVWGDPKNASAETGHRLLEEIIAGLARTITFELASSD